MKTVSKELKAKIEAFKPAEMSVSDAISRAVALIEECAGDCWNHDFGLASKEVMARVVYAHGQKEVKGLCKQVGDSRYGTQRYAESVVDAYFAYMISLRSFHREAAALDDYFRRG
jgi:hypothetical protein